MAELFESGGDLWGAKSTSLKFTEAQRLRAKLNAEKAEVLTGDSVEVNLNSATLTEAGGGTYLLPVAFVEMLKHGRRVGASPQQVLEPVDGPIEDKALNWDHDTQPIYWLHVPINKQIASNKITPVEIESWPVYGYAADYGMGYHVTPLLVCRGTELPGWKEAEWLCRCAQCGRELPPSYYFMNTSGRLKGICRACTSTNHLVDKIFHKAMRYRSEEETRLLVDTRHWYEALWRRNLCPRGDYAAWCIGEADIKERLRLATRHKRGSAPRHPNVISASKLQKIYGLIEETQKDV